MPVRVVNDLTNPTTSIGAITWASAMVATATGTGTFVVYGAGRLLFSRGLGTRQASLAAAAIGGAAAATYFGWDELQKRRA